MANPVAFGPDTADRLLALLDGLPELESSSGGGGKSKNRIFPGAPQTFRNDSGEAVPAFACMKITDAEEDAGTGRYVAVIDKPDSTGGPFVFNGPREVAIDGFGQYHTGLVKASFSAGTPGVGQIWGPLSDWVIVNNGNPAIEVYGNIETDVILGTTVTHADKIGKADADITAGGTGTVSIWRDGADTTENITGVKLDWMDGGDDISSGKEVLIRWFPDEGVWRIVGAECE